MVAYSRAEQARVADEVAALPEGAHITVDLIGHDGNAFTVLGRCRKTARDAGLSEDEIATFMTEATAGDYDHLLQTAMRWFDVR